MLYDTTMRLAQKAQDAKRYADALHRLEEAAKLRSQEAEPHRRMAQIYKLTGRPSDSATAQREADRLVKATPQ
jgi:hypothetical protein